MAFATSSHPQPPQAIIFDLMGTCCDWHSSILPELLSAPKLESISSSQLSQFALDWRAEFFHKIRSRIKAGEEAEDIDVTHRRILDWLISGLGEDNARRWDDTVRQRLVGSWHSQKGFPTVVLANGTTRLQLDIIKSSALPFHTLFSSELLGLSKPNPAVYRKCINLMKVKAEDCLMVAAHAYDLRAAKKVWVFTRSLAQSIFRR
ncbi:MAG: hypothetical protein Q9166_006726 [cf. Caloplaca sp. 2 TL-2023]